MSKQLVYRSTFLLLSISMSLKAQLQIGVNGGLAFPNIAKESNMFKSTVGINTSVYYNTPINLMFGAHLSFFNKMKLNEDWIYARLGKGQIEYNTAHLKHNPMFALSIQYLFNLNYDLTSLYVGFNGGKCVSSMSGETKVNLGSFSNRLGFYGDEYSSFIFSPKFGLTHEILKNLKLNAEIKVDIFYFEKENVEQLINLDLGLVYVFKFKQKE